MTTVKLLMDLGALQLGRFCKVLQKVEMEKAVFLFGQVEMVEGIMIIAIVMVTLILHGHSRLALQRKMD